MKRCKYKCEFTAYSSSEMADYILSQCSPEDIITAWYNLSEGTPALYDGDCDFIIGHFSLSNLLFMYQNNILAEEICDWAFDYVNDWLEYEIYRASQGHMPTLDISVNINKFHIDLTWED